METAILRRVIQRLYRNNGKENGHYYNGVINS